MNLNRFFCVWLLCSIVANTGYTQDTVDEKKTVLFDPLFWKHQLKLDGSQCRKIRQINQEYYESLFRLLEEQQGQPDILRIKATENLIWRHQRIWETFHTRQKRKWKKMWMDNGTSSTASAYGQNIEPAGNERALCTSWQRTAAQELIATYNFKFAAHAKQRI